MSTGLKFRRVAGSLILCVGMLCMGIVRPANAVSSQTHRKAKKPPLPPPLPSGPTGPVQPIPLDSMAPVPPQVSYENAQLTIVAPNSTLADILRAVRRQTGAEIEIPAAPERVVTNLGPGPAREVMAELLNGSRFNYVLLGSTTDSTLMTRVVLVAKSGPDNASPNPPNNPAIAGQQFGIVQASNPAQPQPDMAAEANDTEAPDDTADENADQSAAEAEQPAATPDQPGVKTPQQMLQEMQQRQMQLQQQQPPGQPPIPGPGVPQRPPQEQQ